MVGGIHRADAEMGPGLGGGNAAHFVGELPPPLGQGQKPAARVRQLQPSQALAPDKQRRSHLVLQGLEPGGQGGLGDVQRLGRGRHGPAAQHRQKGLDLHIRHGGSLLKIIDSSLYYKGKEPILQMHFFVLSYHSPKGVRAGRGAGSTAERSVLK